MNGLFVPFLKFVLCGSSSSLVSSWIATMTYSESGTSLLSVLIAVLWPTFFQRLWSRGLLFFVLTDCSIWFFPFLFSSSACVDGKSESETRSDCVPRERAPLAVASRQADADIVAFVLWPSSQAPSVRLVRFCPDAGACNRPSSPSPSYP